MEVGVLSAVTEEGQRQVAEPVVGLVTGVRTLSVLDALGFDACKVLAADVGELEHESVSRSFYVC